jgi:mRNA-degrading endonuclease RelE of RelBE toxin-antitoxin system
MYKNVYEIQIKEEFKKELSSFVDLKKDENNQYLDKLINSQSINEISEIINNIKKISIDQKELLCEFIIIDIDNYTKT